MKKPGLLYPLVGLTVAAAILLTLKGRQRIVSFGKSFIGQQELTDNSGFKSETLERLMREVGWNKGDAWCVYFAKMVWYDMVPRAYRPVILKAISGNSQQAYKNAKNDTTGILKVTKYPKKGDIAIWQHVDNGVTSWRGHAGVVTKVNTGSFLTIEGNTNTSGGSEGYVVAEKQRGYDFTKNNGLRLKGFITFA